MLYLTYEDDDVGISILTFLPQVTSSLQHFFVGPERSTLNNLVDPARLGRWQAFGFGGLDVAVRTKIVLSRKGYLGPITDFNWTKRFIVCRLFYCWRLANNLAVTLATFLSASLLKLLSLWPTTRLSHRSTSSGISAYSHWFSQPGSVWPDQKWQRYFFSGDLRRPPGYYQHTS